MLREQRRHTRRTALKAMTGLVLGVYLKPGSSMAQSGAAQILRPDGSTAGFAPNAFVRIGTDEGSSGAGVKDFVGWPTYLAGMGSHHGAAPPSLLHRCRR